MTNEQRPGPPCEGQQSVGGETNAPYQRLQPDGWSAPPPGPFSQHQTSSFEATTGEGGPQSHVRVAQLDAASQSDLGDIAYEAFPRVLGERVKLYRTLIEEMNVAEE